MTNTEAITLITVIQDTGKKLSVREQSIIGGIERFIAMGKPVSKAQGWALQNVYRRIQQSRWVKKERI